MRDRRGERARPPASSQYELFRGYPFCVLAEAEHVLLSGLCGRIWTVARDYPRLDGWEDFSAWREPGTVQMLFAHWVRPLADGRAELVSETRVRPTDRLGWARLRAVWAVLGPFERLVSAEPLAVAARAAERESSRWPVAVRSAPSLVRRGQALQRGTPPAPRWLEDAMTARWFVYPDDTVA